jgi:hypothetical protein
MTGNAGRAPGALLLGGALAGTIPVAASALDAGSITDLLISQVLTNLAFAVAVVLLGVFGLYAYASLARFAPYHSWIYLYLVSLTGIAWAAFVATTGGSLAEVAFILTTVIGINLIVHVLRFDRIEIPSPFASPAPVSQ